LKYQANYKGSANSADLVLVRPGITHKTDRHWCGAPPLGLGLIASVARENGLEVKVVDGKLSSHLSPDDTVEEVKKYNPKIVGISSMTPEYPLARIIARKLRSRLNKPIIILGGAHANALPAETSMESREFDYIYAGEGEFLFDEVNLGLMESRKNLIGIPGLYSCLADKSDVRCANPRYDYDLSGKMFPAWDLFPRSKVYPVLTERGCPYRCVFCSHNLSTKIRRRPIEHVMEEIKWLHRDFEPQRIHFEDETFGLDNERIESLLKWLCEFNRKAQISFKAQTRVDAVTNGVLRLMKRAGFEYIEFGVESGDPEVIERSGKKISLDRVTRAVKMAREAGLKVWLKFIIGLPGETRKTVRNTINFASRLNPDRISVAVIVAYPGSKIYDWARSGGNGYRFVSQRWDRFDKYFSNSVELTNLSSRLMRRYQIQMYLETYLRNFRLSELISLAANHGGFIRPLLKSVLKN
jgi:radical SAM superfamily enzyme YgiQ (UPF0313 family)